MVKAKGVGGAVPAPPTKGSSEESMIRAVEGQMSDTGIMRFLD